MHLLPPSPGRLGLPPEYALLQSAVGGGGGYQAGGGGMGGMGGMGNMRGGTPPLDPAAQLAQVNLAGFGLGGLGNGECAVGARWVAVWCGELGGCAACCVLQLHAWEAAATPAAASAPQPPCRSQLANSIPRTRPFLPSPSRRHELQRRHERPGPAAAAHALRQWQGPLQDAPLCRGAQGTLRVCAAGSAVWLVGASCCLRLSSFASASSGPRLLPAARLSPAPTAHLRLAKNPTRQRHCAPCSALQSVGDEALARIFRTFPGIEYCDLKKVGLCGSGWWRWGLVTVHLHPASSAAA